MRKFLEKLGLDADVIDAIDKESGTRLGEAEGKIASLTSELEKMRTECRELEQKHIEEINNINKNNAVDNALAKAGAKTLKAVKALIDTDKIVIDENGDIKGLDEQIRALQTGEDTGYLFNKNNGFKGVLVGNSSDENISVEDMNYTQLCAYFEGR